MKYSSGVKSFVSKLLSEHNKNSEEPLTWEEYLNLHLKEDKEFIQYLLLRIYKTAYRNGYDSGKRLKSGYSVRHVYKVGSVINGAKFIREYAGYKVREGLFECPYCFNYYRTKVYNVVNRRKTAHCGCQFKEFHRDDLFEENLILE